MKAFVLREPGRLTVDEVPTPEAKPDTAIVKIECASICGTDIRTYRHGSEKIRPPRILGHESSAVIVDLGRDVKGFSQGQRVVVAPAVGCGVCASCVRGHTNMCDDLRTIGFEYDGTFAEYMEIPARAFSMGNVLPLEDGLAGEEATLAEPVACCINGQNFLNIEEGDFVLIFGAGFIGCIHAELAFQKGAAKVLMVDIAPERLSSARKLVEGITVLDSRTADVVAAVRDMSGGRGADVVITANPDGRTHQTATRAAAKRGRISLFGGTAGNGENYLASNEIHYKELAVFGSHATPPSNVRLVLEWVRAGKIDLKKYVSGVFSLERIEEAFEGLRNAAVMKYVVRP